MASILEVGHDFLAHGFLGQYISRLRSMALLIMRRLVSEALTASFRCIVSPGDLLNVSY